MFLSSESLPNTPTLKFTIISRSLGPLLFTCFKTNATHKTTNKFSPNKSFPFTARGWHSALAPDASVWFPLRYLQVFFPSVMILQLDFTFLYLETFSPWNLISASQFRHVGGCKVKFLCNRVLLRLDVIWGKD